MPGYVRALWSYSEVRFSGWRFGVWNGFIFTSVDCWGYWSCGWKSMNADLRGYKLGNGLKVAWRALKTNQSTHLRQSLLRVCIWSRMAIREMRNNMIFITEKFILYYFQLLKVGLCIPTIVISLFIIQNKSFLYCASSRFLRWQKKSEIKKARAHWIFSCRLSTWFQVGIAMTFPFVMRYCEDVRNFMIYSRPCSA